MDRACVTCFAKADNLERFSIFKVGNNMWQQLYVATKPKISTTSPLQKTSANPCFIAQAGRGMPTWKGYST